MLHQKYCGNTRLALGVSKCQHYFFNTNTDLTHTIHNTSGVCNKNVICPYFLSQPPFLKNAKKMVLAQLNHRNEREVDILNSISRKGSKINKIVDSVYHDLSDNLKIAASRNVLAHQIHLLEKGLVIVDDDNMSLDSIFKIK